MEVIMVAGRSTRVVVFSLMVKEMRAAFAREVTGNPALIAA